MLRHPAIALFSIATLALSACQGASAPPTEEAAPTAATEATPAADAPAGTESGGAKVAEAPSPTGEWKAFGSTYEAGDVIKAKDFLLDPSSHLNQMVTVEGTVVDVCQKAGCWLVISDGENQMRVRTKNHGFAVDKDCQGQWAQIHGKVVSMEITAEEAAHFAEESNRPDVAPESGKAETLFEIEASAVKLKKKAS